MAQTNANICILWLWKIQEHDLVFLFIYILKTVYL